MGTTLLDELELASGLRGRSEDSVFGQIDNFLVQLQLLESGHWVREVVRFPTDGDTTNEAVEEAIACSEALRNLQDDGMGPITVEHGIAHYAHRRRSFRSIDPDRVARELRAILDAVESVVPVPTELACEDCGAKGSFHPLLLDGDVTCLCPTCIQDLHERLEILRSEYASVQSHYPRAFAWGGIAALAGGGIWAAVSILTGYMLALAGVGVGVLVGFIVTRLACKGGAITQLTAVFWTLLGVVFGQLLIAGHFIQQTAGTSGERIDWVRFVLATPELLMAGGEDTLFALFCGVVGAFFAARTAAAPDFDTTVQADNERQGHQI